MTGFDDYITKPDQFYNPPVAGAFVDGNPLTFQLPAIANRLAETDAYVLVVPFDCPKARAECYSKSRSITSYSGMQTTETTYILRS